MLGFGGLSTYGVSDPPLTVDLVVVTMSAFFRFTHADRIAVGFTVQRGIDFRFAFEDLPAFSFTQGGPVEFAFTVAGPVAFHLVQQG